MFMYLEIGRYSRDFTYVKDAAKIFYKIYTSRKKFRSEVVNIGSGKNYSINKIFKKIFKIV